jgi:hypothetical protein
MEHDKEKIDVEDNLADNGFDQLKFQIGGAKVNLFDILKDQKLPHIYDNNDDDVSINSDEEDEENEEDNNYLNELYPEYNNFSNPVSEAKVIFSSKSVPVKSEIPDEDEELMIQLAMIAQMEECEKKGVDFSMEINDSNFSETDTKQLPDGSIYFGQFDKDGLPHGKGVLMDDECIMTIYDGQYFHGQKQGYGKFFIIKNKDKIGGTIEGTFYKEQPHGHCQYVVNNKLIYEGEYDFGVPSGFGTIYRPNGMKYVGRVYDMRGHGDGKLYDNKNTLIYEGKFAHDYFEGHGKVYKDGLWWEGEFHQGVMNGVFETISGFRHIQAQFVNNIQGEIISEEMIKLTDDQEKELDKAEYDFYTSDQFKVVL